uniref:Prothymosin alpha n=1 Tax=Plectus sambesii TaxID=2011161 RepID=A0A914WRZ8_9BILA
KNGEEEVAVGAAPKNDAAEADANEQEDGPQELKEGNAAHPDDTDYKDDEEKSDNAKEDGHGA